MSYDAALVIDCDLHTAHVSDKLVSLLLRNLPSKAVVCKNNKRPLAQAAGVREHL